MTSSTLLRAWASNMYVIVVPAGSGHWVLRWPSGSVRRFRSRAVAQRVAAHLPARTCSGARVVPAPTFVRATTRPAQSISTTTR